MTLPKIALGAWSWGVGAAGGDQVFGNHLFEEELKPVFDKAMECGLNLWDTAAVYGEGTSERILGNFVKDADRKDVILSTKFTPQIAGDSPSAMQEIITDAHGKSSAQVILRWNLQKGVVVIPGSSNPDHIKENTELFDFELTEDEMEQINALDRGEKHDWY